MTNWLLRRFIKTDNPHDPAARTAAGTLAGWVGIISNVILTIVKVLIGAVAGSASVLADGLNNLLDAVSSVISLIGFKLGAKKADKEHPYGHGRFEYIAGLVVAVIVLLVGVELAKTGIDKIINPTPVTYTVLSLGVLVLTILLKLWQSRFNQQVGEHINSSALKATAADSRNDALSTAAVVTAAVIVYFTGVNLDGWMSLAVALFIIYNGVMLIKDALDPLIGLAPDPELVAYIKDKLLADECVTGARDILVHDYGPGRIYASAIVEIDGSIDAPTAHAQIDALEDDFRENEHINLVIHHDPVAADRIGAGQ